MSTRGHAPIAPETQAQASSGLPVTAFFCGERQRGDDAVAFVLLDALPRALRRRFARVHVGAPDPGPLLDALAVGPCIVVDAVSGCAPGAIVTMPLEAIARSGHRQGSRAVAGPRSSHLLTLAATLALVETLLDAPLRGTFVGIGVRDCSFGEGLSAEVADALPAALRALDAALAQLDAEAEAATTTSSGGQS